MSKESISINHKHQNNSRFISLIDDVKRRLSNDPLHYTDQSQDSVSLEKTLIVSIAEQKLYSLNKNDVEKSYLISTAEAGIGNFSGSFQTPLGIHRIIEKIGSNADLGSVFKGRKNTHQIADILRDPNIRSESDNITSRILRLEGLEDGFNRGVDKDSNNVDSFSRYIYIHGTDEEGQLGKPVSHGCVRMANQDIVELFESVEAGQLVLIIKD